KLNQKKVSLVVLDQNIDTSTSEGRLLLNLLGTFAEFENDIRRERQMDGIERAKARGHRFGAQPKLNQDQIKEMTARKDAGEKIKTLMEDYDIARATVYRLANEYKAAQSSE
ncbi:MAG: recombinase family protein, partial [Chloroflexota bacterium]